MWGTLLGLIERWWREKPRLDIVRAVVHLRDSMLNCQNRYEKFMKASSARTPKHAANIAKLRDEWYLAVEGLVVSLAEIDTVLTIFEPEMRKKVRLYLHDESDSVDVQRALDNYAARLGDASEIDIPRDYVDPAFHRTLNDLDAFIKTNFKIEEVQSVMKGRLR